MDSLGFPHMYTREDAIASAHKGTFGWIMGRQTSKVNRWAGCTFMEWLQQDGPDHTMFWLSGKPASGKSTLMKYIHTEERYRLEELLRQWTQSVKPLIVGFYFSAESENNLGRTREGLLRALLHQILTQCQEMRSAVLRKKLEMQDWTLGSYIRPSSVAWTWKELQDMFRIALSGVHTEKHIYIFADGLDEYHAVDNSGKPIQTDDDADARFEGHGEVAELFLGLANNPHLKICVASRSQQPFDDLFQHITSKKLRLRMEDLTSADISTLVTERLSSRANRDRLDTLETGLGDELIRNIIKKSDGVFTWVDLVTRRLSRCIADGDNPDEIRAYLSDVPSKLGDADGLYMSLLREIPNRHRSGAARLLKILMTSRHPLTAVALSYCETEPGDVVKSPKKKRTYAQLKADAAQMERRIRSRCAGILEMGINPSRRDFGSHMHINKEPVVRFIHLTAREFLRKSTAWEYLLPANSATDLDVSVCLLGSCLLRLKRIGVTGDHEDVWGAVHDAIYYAGKAEKATMVPQTSLLDDLDATMSWLTKHQWPVDEDNDSDSDEWPDEDDDDDNDDDNDDDIETKVGPDEILSYSFDMPNYTFVSLKRKQFFREGYHWVSLEPQEQGGKKYSTCDNFLTYAVWGNLELYLRSKRANIKERALKERAMAINFCDGVPGARLSTRSSLLELAIAPYDPPSLINYSSDNGDRLGTDQCNSTIVRILLESGYNPGEMSRSNTVWENMMCWRPRLDAYFLEPHISCQHDFNFMDIMKVIIEYGANPNIVAVHWSRDQRSHHSRSLLFVASTCADISVDQRKDLISLLRKKGSELFPGEAAKLRKVAPWADIETWP
ncbi:hypothetical protein BCR34DRAFT_239446, partial [Clohesyomyces aquaticus]